MGASMSEIRLAGSCLCGSVQYEVAGDDSKFYHCHCERCRKATGTGHATNIILRSDAVRWTAGESLLKRYDVPEAKRFATVFCSNCGSLMPRVSPEFGIVVIPAGTLDVDPGIRPEARIFEDSRAAWSCEGGDLPGFAEYPD
jgi:hypothetical protein